MEAQGERIYSFYSFMNSEIDGMSGQRHAALYGRGKDPQTPSTHWIGGWVGL
jgi:hypothetical protein